MPFEWAVGKAVGLMWTWEQWKGFIEASVGFSHDAIHAAIGVVIQLAAGGILRKPISDSRPWLVVLLLICLNEFADLSLGRWPHLNLRSGESTKDVLITMFLPTLLLLSVRSWPQLFASRK